jgi:hypothetical protein
MTQPESGYPSIMDLFEPKPNTDTRLEVRVSNKKAILFAVEETHEQGKFTFTFPILGGKIRGVRRIAKDLLVDRPDVSYKEIDTT